MISGNGINGIRIAGAGATRNVVEGTGSAPTPRGANALGNRVDGVLIVSAASGNVIGGSSAGAGNLIDGSVSSGVHVALGATHNTFKGNLVGLNASGRAAMGNGNVGIFIDGAAANVFGGSGTAANFVTGDGQTDISLVGAGSSNNVIDGNLVGTDITGGLALAAAPYGIMVDNAPNNLIGGSSPGEGNTVDGHSAIGIDIANPSATGNVVIGNIVGPIPAPARRWGTTTGSSSPTPPPTSWATRTRGTPTSSAATRPTRSSSSAPTRPTRGSAATRSADHPPDPPSRPSREGDFSLPATSLKSIARFYAARASMRPDDRLGARHPGYPSRPHTDWRVVGVGTSQPRSVVQGLSTCRKANRERPIIGDRRTPSKLGEIQPDHWLAEYTTKLLNVLHVLGRLVALEQAQPSCSTASAPARRSPKRSFARPAPSPPRLAEDGRPVPRISHFSPTDPSGSADPTGHEEGRPRFSQNGTIPNYDPIS